MIHLHEPLMPALPLTVLYHAEARKVGTFHAFSESNLGYFYARPLLQPFFERLDARIAVSRPAADFVGRYFGGDYEIIPNGIEIGAIRAGVAPLPQYRDGRPTILFVGRFDEPRKGFRYLLRAFALVRDQFPDARLLVVGGGDPELYRDDLTRQRRRQGIEFAGYVETRAAAALLRQLRRLLLPLDQGREFRHHPAGGDGLRARGRRHRASPATPA